MYNYVRDITKIIRTFYSSSVASIKGNYSLQYSMQGDNRPALVQCCSNVEDVGTALHQRWTCHDDRMLAEVFCLQLASTPWSN